MVRDATFNSTLPNLPYPAYNHTYVPTNQGQNVNGVPPD